MLKNLIEKYKIHRLRVLSLSLIFILSLSILLMIMYTYQLIDNYQSTLENNSLTQQSANNDELDNIDSLIDSVDDSMSANDLTLQSLGEEDTTTPGTTTNTTDIDKSISELDNNVNSQSALTDMNIPADQN